ncbi:MAG: DUF308 domain-containing protein [Leptolyngbya sp. Prado105]|jgi:uncharacterized membrane protein HdeD (DUF308 family)|nr:DUF308 domain-containing protein [Leptolyngbya sp. Prado105]
MRVEDSESTEQKTQAASGWGIVIGSIMGLLGLVAIARPLYATIASTLVFGWLFVVAGIALVAYACQSNGVGKILWKLLLAALYLIGGIYLISNVVTGAIFLTIALGIIIFGQGIVQVFMAFELRARDRGVMIVGGILNIILGIFVWSNFPSNAAWILGVWVGLNLLTHGVWILSLSLAKRSAVR